MLEQMMRAVARKIIAQEYPHAKSPAVVYATVSKATQLGETFDLEDLVIHNDETGSSFKGPHNGALERIHPHRRRSLGERGRELPSSPWRQIQRTI